MSDPSYAFQVGVAAALLGDATFTGIMGQAVFDPLSAAGQPYPLTEIGDDFVIPGASALTDELWGTIHFWADGPAGRLLVKQAFAAAREVLAPRPPDVPALTVAGFKVTSGVLHMVRFMTEDDPTDPSVTIAHANAQFRFQLAPTA